MVEPSASLDVTSREIGTNEGRNQPGPARPNAPASVGRGPSGKGGGSDLEKDLSRVEGKRWLRRIGILLGIVALVGAFMVYRAKTKPKPPPRYVTAQSSKGDVFETVQSTGQVQPLTQVQV